MNTDYEKKFYDMCKQATAAAHVIIEAGIGHDDLDRCGCEECELVRKGMTEAGFLRPRPTAGTEE